MIAPDRIISPRSLSLSVLFCMILLVSLIISYHIISYNIISYHIISYHIISYNIISYHIILYHIISYHIISYHIISYHIISFRSRSLLISYDHIFLPQILHPLNTIAVTCEIYLIVAIALERWFQHCTFQFLFWTIHCCRKVEIIFLVFRFILFSGRGNLKIVQLLLHHIHF